MELCDWFEQLDYDEQVGMTEWGMPPEIYEKQDYFRIREIMTARSPEDRPQDPASLLNH